MKYLMMLSILVLCVGAVGQTCPTPADDGFWGGGYMPPLTCCQTPITNLPVLDTYETQGIWYCDNNCAVQTPYTVTVSLTGLAQLALPFTPSCTHYSITLSVTPVSAGAPTFSGVGFMSYMNTWLETSTIGDIQGIGQIWRFHVSMDVAFIYEGEPPTPCPVPPDGDKGAGEQVWLVGTIDFYCGDIDLMGTQGLRVRYDLHHMCDAVAHAAGTARPGVFHPAISYHLVGPTPVALGAPVFPGLNFFTAWEQREANVGIGGIVCFIESAATPLTLAASFMGPIPCQCGTTNPSRFGSNLLSTPYQCFQAELPSTNPTIPSTTTPPTASYFACTHPIVTGFFPEGRNVIHRYGPMSGPMANMIGPSCPTATVTDPEFTSGVSTVYTSTRFQSYYFKNAGPPPGPVSNTLQTDVANHVDYFTFPVAFPPRIWGAPTWASWFLSAQF